MKVLAFAVSMLFHPLLLPLYVLFITFNTGTVFTYIPAYTQNMSYLLTLLGVTLIPLLCLPLLKWLGLIEGYPSGAETRSGVPGAGDESWGLLSCFIFPVICRILIS